jgi:hypothetical protein
MALECVWRTETTQLLQSCVIDKNNINSQGRKPWAGISQRFQRTVPTENPRVANSPRHLAPPIQFVIHLGRFITSLTQEPCAQCCL